MVRKNECLREFDVKNFLGLLSIYRMGWVLSLQIKKKEKIQKLKKIKKLEREHAALSPRRPLQWLP